VTVRIHPTAIVDASAVIGDGTQIWLHCQIRDGVRIGEQCILGKNIYVDSDVQIGSRVKIQNNVSLYVGVTIEDGVFLGPHRVPRAINPDGSLKGLADWHVDRTRVETGAAIGANSTIVCGVTIGAWAMVGSGSVVIHDVPAYALVYGNPARIRGWVTPSGERARFDDSEVFVGSDGFTLRRHRGETSDRVEVVPLPADTGAP